MDRVAEGIRNAGQKRRFRRQMLLLNDERSRSLPATSVVTEKVDSCNRRVSKVLLDEISAHVRGRTARSRYARISSARLARVAWHKTVGARLVGASLFFGRHSFRRLVEWLFRSRFVSCALAPNACVTGNEPLRSTTDIERGREMEP